MAGVSATPLAQPPYPTPSPFSFSVTSSSRWNSRPSIDRASLTLRSLALLFSFLSAVLLASASSNKNHHVPSNFTGYPKLLYCFVVYILVFVYSGFQLIIGVCDILHRGLVISDMVSDYTTFILDQLTAYLLVSSCTVAILSIRHIGRNSPFWNSTVASTSISFAAFIVIATCSILSGYKLCKRIIW